MNAMETYIRSRDLAQLILNIGTRCNRIVSFMPRPLSSPETKVRHTWDKRMNGPRPSPDVLDRNLLSVSGNRTPDRPVHCAVPMLFYRNIIRIL